MDLYAGTEKHPHMVARIDAEMDIMNERLSMSEIVSPVRGLVLQSELEKRIGARVQTG